ncbi:monosaccharide ABC transporter substrate-binding protein (CUT2 family) [Hydrogenispora ethanolica]|uniref:Monosaccharide ABC transporter substrate-binding protein (CUT2 family) n=1 Tax=Hydrogenispora ethanolica TaxID=1082276 RepID=A0A4V2QFE5_HYDET|nr:substrate-binding domain-containing protein [Hydrogenispora ethanolica]TCL71637.1 monosaccharide ABC transporter substrate-binding protein (CUT2 family) [Hydrogenispora ethanolica]
MQRLFNAGSVLLVILMVLGIAVSAAPKKQVVVGVSLLTREHVFYNNIESALVKKAKELGVKLIVQDASKDSNKQLSQVQDFITQKVNAIILCPTNSAGSKSMVELANKAKIPVFTMDISSDGKTVAHVATDNYKGGELAAEYVAKKMLPGAKGEVAIVTYSEVESCVNREKGFKDFLTKNYPNIKVVDVQNCSGDQAKAADVTQNMLLKHPNLQVIFGVGDPFAMGALSAIKAANKNVQVIGFDGNPEGINEIKSGGLWKADVAQDPAAIGAKTLEAVMTKLKGKNVPKLIPIAPKIIDKSNL